jgi:P63C domain
MKLSQYAKLKGVHYQTARNWFLDGTLKGTKMPSGTIILEAEQYLPENKVSTKKIIDIDPTIIKATHKGVLNIADIEIPCFVLENGQRVISGRKMQTALSINSTGGQKMVSFLSKGVLKPFIDAETLVAISEPIKFKMKSLITIGYGYETKVLNRICKALLAYRRQLILDNKHIPESDLRIINSAEILQGAFAEVGLISLVDEATGYQGDRQKDELQKILSAYISKELLPWQKRFPNEYYEQIAKLRGWDFDPLSNKRPQIIGKITNQVVYKLLPEGVLDELKKVNPPNESGNRNHRFHQFLSLDIGNVNLERHLSQVIVLMRISKTWAEFEDKLYDAFPRFGQTEKLI